MIGLKRNIVKLVPYENQWEQLYKVDEKLLYLLAGDYIADVQHIGSTSIIGLDAKPIIDILVGVKSFDYMPEFIGKLENAGFVYRPESGTDERVLFIKGGEDFRTHHVHVVEWGKKEWTSHILFRDYLRNHKEAAHAYCKLKKELAEKFPQDRVAYTDGKSDFIQQIIDQAKAELG